MKAHNKIHDIAMIYGQMHDHGFKGMIFRSSNEKVIQFHTFLGGKILKEVPFIIKDQEFKLFFMQEDFDNPNLQKVVAEAKTASSAVPQQSSLWSSHHYHKHPNPYLKDSIINNLLKIYIKTTNINHFYHD